MAGTCKRGYEPSGSIKCGQFLDYLRTGELLKKDSAPWSELLSQSHKKGVTFTIYK